MNKLRLLHFFVASLCLFAFTSCGNDDDAEPSQQALLTAGVWEGTSIYYDNQDYTQFFRDSLGFEVNDFSLRFDDDGEYRQMYSPVPTTVGTWEFTGTDQEEVLLDRGENYESRAFINELTSTELHLESGAWFGTPVEIRFTRP